mgnify:CR=1 FL=1
MGRVGGVLCRNSCPFLVQLVVDIEYIALVDDNVTMGYFTIIIIYIASILEI